MKMMMRVSIPVKRGNKALSNGKLKKAFDLIHKKLQPEASYFFLDGGKRSAMFIYHCKDSALLPEINEPIFKMLHAKIEHVAALNFDELSRGLKA